MIQKLNKNFEAEGYEVKGWCYKIFKTVNNFWIKMAICAIQMSKNNI